ncbi:MAG: DUF4332 domain-containing protein [Anaerolineae bacterium]
MFSANNILLGLQIEPVTLSGVYHLLQAPGQANNTPWWLLWLLVVIGLLSVLVAWAIERGQEEPQAQTALATSIEAAAPDDLTRIEGIGPKISSLLQTAGIATFSQLATTGVDRLQEILDEAGLRLADPGTWPEQAQLAAAGDWGTLDTLQNELKGGRRVT